MHIEKDLVAAPATPFVLAILAGGESDGYAILKRVRELAGDELEWPDGMIYPLLHRLSRLGYVATDWRAAPERPCRRYYRITPTGQRARAERRRKGAKTTGPSGDIWSMLLVSSEARPLRVRRRIGSAFCPLSVLAVTANRMGAHR